MAWLRERKSARGTVWFVQWRDAAGKIHSERVGFDRTLAEARRRVVDGAVRSGDATAAPSHADALDRFLANLKIANRADGTLTYYRQHLGRLFDRWRDVPLVQWCRRDLEAYLAEHPGWSPRRIQMVVRACRRFSKWAAQAGIAVSDWTAGLEIPTVRTPERRTPTIDQVNAVLAASTGRRLELAVHLAACAGLSLGDIRALTWDDIDASCEWITRKRRKTGTPIRVPIIPRLASSLRRHRSINGPVCRLLPKSDHSLHAQLRRIYAKAGVPSCGVHGLRHAWATMMLKAGVPHVTIGRLLAHTPGSSMTARYLRHDDAQLIEAMRAIDRAIGSA
jgi:integrase